MKGAFCQVCQRHTLILFYYFFYTITINISSALPERASLTASRASVIHDPCKVLGIIQHPQYLLIHVPSGRTEDRATNGRQPMLSRAVFICGCVLGQNSTLKRCELLLCGAERACRLVKAPEAGARGNFQRKPERCQTHVFQNYIPVLPLYPRL